MNFTADPETPHKRIGRPFNTLLRCAQARHAAVYLVESSPEDQLQPKLDSSLSQARRRLPIRKLHLFDEGAEISVTTRSSQPVVHRRLRWERIRQFTFSTTSAGIRCCIVAWTQRPAPPGRSWTKPARPSSTTPADRWQVSGRQRRNRLDVGTRWLNHLYLYGAKRSRENQIAKGEWWSPAWMRRSRRRIWFRAPGVRSGQTRTRSRLPGELRWLG